MNNKIVILGKGKVGESNIPSSVKVWESKWERDINDRVRFEGEEWRVISCGFHSKEEAREVKDGMIGIWIQKGYWSGSRKRTSKF